MTHSLHRRGSIESLQNDICMLAQPHKGINDVDSRLKTRQFLKTAHEYGANNMGSVVTGNMVTFPVEVVLERVQDGRSVFVVFDDKGKAGEFLQKLKEMDLGMSVVVTALWDLVKDMCEKAGVAPHTVNRSLGAWGKLSLLPEEKIQEITSMCGHAQVSPNLVRKMFADIEKGRITPRDAALKLATPCVCGFFNLTRAEKLLACCKHDS